MTSPKPFRFGVLSWMTTDPGCWVHHVKRIESLGFSTLLLGDHFVPDFFGDQLAPLPAITAAATATTRLRVGTLTIGNDFRNPVMLAKETATIDHLSNGRFELGIGAGWMAREYEAAGFPYERGATRVERLTESVRIIKEFWSGRQYSFQGRHYSVKNLDPYPLPVQEPGPPILIGAGKRKMLQFAGAEADIVNVLIASLATGVVVDDPWEGLASTVAEKVAWIREGAGDRFDQIELSMTASFAITDDRAAWAEATIKQRGWTGVTVDDVLAMPGIFVGTEAEIANQMHERRARYGFSYFVVFDELADDIAPIVRNMTGK